MEHQRSCELESSENKSKTQLHENIPPLQEIVKPQAAVTTHADVHEQPQKGLLGFEAILSNISIYCWKWVPYNRNIS